jgi:hypothetical protein
VQQVNNASLTVPRMMFGTIIFNGITGFVSVITYCFVVTDIQQEILGTTAVYPWIAVFAKATGSAAGAIGKHSFASNICLSGLQEVP